MNRFKEILREIGNFFIFFIETLYYFLENLKKPVNIIENIYNIGVKSLPVVVSTGFFLGLIMGLQLSDALESIISGTSQYISGALSVALVKELGPVFTSLIVVSRVCSSVTAHIGTMKVTEQIDALKTFGINPVGFLATPRVIAGMISLPILGFFSIMASMIGAWIMIGMLGEIPLSVYIEVAQIPLKVKYILESIFKMIIIGGFILEISTFYGFEAKNGAAGVGEATIKSVVVSSFMVILLDYILGSIFIILSGGTL
ncbi:MAG: ABC transporter permease [Brevinematales bacterium]|nr:ABC transporter permease [Brevinematales bacterium]